MYHVTTKFEKRMLIGMWVLFIPAWIPILAVGSIFYILGYLGDVIYRSLFGKELNV